MRDGQYRLLWTGVSNSKKMRAVQGDKIFRMGCHLVYTWLLPWCDDDGRMPGEPLKILANVVPNEGFTLKEIEKIIEELDQVGLIRSYSICDESFILIEDWEKYQHIRKDRYKSSIYPPPPERQPNDNQATTNGLQSDNLILSPSPSPSHSHPKNGLTELFEKFWSEYPKKKSKGDAEKVWLKIKPDNCLLEKMVITIKKSKSSEEWIKDKGKWIPYPATWLNAKGWEDEVEIRDGKVW